MPVRSCRVTITDLEGIAHTVDVTAASLYEAVALGLAAIRSDDWVAGIARATDGHGADVVVDFIGADYAQKNFEVAAVEPPSALVYRSVRGRTAMTWSLTLIPLPFLGPPAGEHTRIHLRLRLAPVRRKWLADTAGGFIDFLTIAGMAAGLKERVER